MRPLIGITGRKDTSARLLNSPMHCVGATYVKAIHQVGGMPVILPTLMTEDDWSLLVQRLDGVLLSGGEDIAPKLYGQAPEAWLGGVDEERDQGELGLTRLAVSRGIPVFGICRGSQTLNVALGGTLYQDIAAHIPNALDHAYVPGRPIEQNVHSVTVEPGSRLAAILKHTQLNVNSAHHQSVQKPGTGLRVVAQAPDGVIEGLEMPDYSFCLAVQWHPEAMVPEIDVMWALFEAFIQAASAYATTR